jgi:hypothetical protein
LGRAEFRQDWANRAVFKRGSTNALADSNQTTLELQLLYQF